MSASARSTIAAPSTPAGEITEDEAALAQASRAERSGDGGGSVSQK
ncbi:MAG: hypothetical protein ACHQHO_09400 [Solirubrobacterales bacterium]